MPSHDCRSRRCRQPVEVMIGLRRTGPTLVRRSADDMAEAAERAAHVAGERAHIGALAAFGLEHRVVGVGRLDQIEAVDVDRARLELHHLAVAGEVIGALAVDLDGREARRHLRDGAGEARQQRADRLGRRPQLARRRDAPFGVVGVALLAPAHREAVALAAVHDERDGLGRLAERDRQEARGERIERAGMAGALGLEQRA